MASGLCAALTGRTHGCTDQPASVKKTLANSEPSTHANVKKTLANSEPSTHGTELPIPNVRSSVANGGKADKICSMRVLRILTRCGLKPVRNAVAHQSPAAPNVLSWREERD